MYLNKHNAIEENWAQQKKEYPNSTLDYYYYRLFNRENTYMNLL